MSNIMTGTNLVRIKLIVVGDTSVGKSSIVDRYVDDTFKQERTPTIGADIRQLCVELPDAKTRVRLDIWDTAGQER